jgi:hypothetical protein
MATDFNQTTQCYTKKDKTLPSHCCEKPQNQETQKMFTKCNNSSMSGLLLQAESTITLKEVQLMGKVHWT